MKKKSLKSHFKTSWFKTASVALGVALLLAEALVLAEVTVVVVTGLAVVPEVPLVLEGAVEPLAGDTVV